MNYSLKKYGIFFFVVWFHSIPSSLSQTYYGQYQLEMDRQQLQNAEKEYQDRMKAIREIDELEDIYLKKTRNGFELLKKGDRSGGCRDLYMVMDLYQEIETRDMIYAVKYPRSAKGEIAHSKKRALFNQHLNNTKNIYAKECR